jgi:DNA replication and repair protein RecF
VELSLRSTVLSGPNGQGKTNFLEACHLVATLRPLRAQKLSELVRLGAERASVRARFALAGGERVVEVFVEGGKRSARVDGKAIRDPQEVFGGVAVVAFTPDDLWLVKGGPDGRRKLLDRAVQNLHPVHLSDTREYLKALKSRNHLLKSGAPSSLREAFDVPLAQLGARLRLRREQVLREIVPRAREAFLRVARGEEPLVAVYQAAGRDSAGLGPDALSGGEEGLTARLLEAFARRLSHDQERGHTSVGPHMDDLALSLGDKPARLFASQGQGRAIVLALRIGEIENLEATQGRAPLLLLDDVSSELDPERNRFLMEYLSAQDGQVVITTTDPALVSAGAPGARFFTVRAGTIV